MASHLLLEAFHARWEGAIELAFAAVATCAITHVSEMRLLIPTRDPASLSNPNHVPFRTRAEAGSEPRPPPFPKAGCPRAL